MKKLIIASLIVATSGPAWARSEHAGGANGNGNSTGNWCYASIPFPALMNRGPHYVPCWADLGEVSPIH